jgi:hypothetical protein
VPSGQLGFVAIGFAREDGEGPQADNGGGRREEKSGTTVFYTALRSRDQSEGEVRGDVPGSGRVLQELIASRDAWHRRAIWKRRSPGGKAAFQFPSGRRDLNPGPPAPEAGALTGLRYAPSYGQAHGCAFFTHVPLQCIVLLLHAPKRTRTSNLLIRSQMLYPIELWARVRQWALQDSNL